MKTLLIPCAGKSSRFPNMRPKWLLTHPDGKLMVQKAIEKIDLTQFDQVVFTIVREHDRKYGASLILRQALESSLQNMNIKMVVCILEDFTSSPSETIYLTAQKVGLQGLVVVKDSDNVVGLDGVTFKDNSVVGLNINKVKNVSNLPGKSFLIVNEQALLLDIVEKEIVSPLICLGVYIFKDISDFCNAYNELNKFKLDGELYVSNVISYLIAKKNLIFQFIETVHYKDFGTLTEWKEEQIRNATYFIDFDGVLIKNSGNYGEINWSNQRTLLLKNCDRVRKLQERGAQIVITTFRPKKFEELIYELLSTVGIKPRYVITGLNHAPRILINDFAPSNPYPSASAISLPRDSEICDYI